MRIAADSAAFGEPVEAFLDDRRLFWDAFYCYYVDFEPEHAWVAVVEQDVVGFLVGCTDMARRDRCMATRDPSATGLGPPARPLPGGTAHMEVRAR